MFTKHVLDTAFTVTAEVVNTFSVFYKIYEVAGGDKETGPIYNRKDQPGFDPVDDLADAAVFASGTVKWDGCSDWDIPDQPLHFCGRPSGLGEVLAACWDWTAELIPDRWDSTQAAPISDTERLDFMLARQLERNGPGIADPRAAIDAAIRAAKGMETLRTAVPTPVDLMREKFEAKFPIPSQCVRCGNGYAATGYNAWDAHNYSHE